MKTKKKTYQFIINTSFDKITLNKYINAERKNKYFAAKLKKSMQNKIKYLAYSLNFKLPEKKKFDVEFTWFKPNNKVDHDNISFCQKFVFDALIDLNILHGDSPKFIRNLYHTFEICNNRNYISCIVTFTEID